MNMFPSSLSDFYLESYYSKITTRSKVIYWIVIGSISAVLASLPFIYIDISIQARGYLQSELDRQSIQSSNQGKVIFTNLKNATKVKRGDTLLVIDFTSLKAKEFSIKTRISELKVSIHDLEILTSMNKTENFHGLNLITDKYLVEYEEMRSREIIREQIYLKRKSEHERNQILYEQRIIPEAEFESSLFILNSEKENLNQILIYQKSLWHNDLMSKNTELSRLNSELVQCKEEITSRALIAPVNGEIIQSLDIQVGSLINAGQKIVEISPDGSLIALCFVNPKDIGFLKKGQKVKIQVDAFNYNEWGLIDADIIEISDDIVMENETMAGFRIKCKPIKEFLELKNGHRAKIRKGMSINARIFIIKRSLFNILLDKSAAWFNPYDH